jgi:hypothetical protein
MKKIVTLAFLLIAGKFVFAQDGDAKLKNFRFGLKVSPMLAWYKPDDKKKLETSGVLFKFGWGLMTEFRLNKIASFTTGLQIDYDGGGLSFKDTAFYYYSADNIIAKADTGGKKYEFYRLTKRNYNINYVTVPIILKMKTNEIGYMTYFGNFGINSSFKTKVRSDDFVVTTTGATANQQDLDISDDAALFKFALNVGVGLEYTFSGSTALVVGVNYINGFSNILKPESKFLFRSANNNYEPFKQKAFGNNVSLTVGVLF